jgi:alpha-tubulin suppressor-like RCC1 family protein
MELSGRDCTRLALGLDHTCLVTGKGDLYSWGNNHQGQLGHTDHIMHWTPRLLEKYTEYFSEVSCGYGFTAAITRMSTINHVIAIRACVRACV